MFHSPSKYYKTSQIWNAVVRTSQGKTNCHLTQTFPSHTKRWAITKLILAGMLTLYKDQIKIPQGKKSHEPSTLM